ncbi:MAG: DinB family protein [Acidobacteria bacterium]|nr:DinB family protein [Acidobacteriota bacterium]
MANSLPEVWLRGPVAGIAPALQPIAHALLQAREEVEAMMQDFPEQKLWDRPAGVASVGFHLQHFSGVLSRLFTYARGESLDPAQREALAAEQEPSRVNVTVQDLVHAFRQQVDRAIEELRATDERTLTEPRAIGRNKLPSTKLGLIVHAAEHTQRHVGQLLVTARIVRP